MNSPILIDFDKKIEEHFKTNSTSLAIEMTPREIWVIAKEIPLNSREYMTFYKFEQGEIQEIWYRGARLKRKEVK